jgi:DNA-binding CsgD family transcriptional regulator
MKEDFASGLAPRQRATLALLLQGCSDKEIAARLSISRFTVNQYNKAIFRNFAVQSRAALLAKLLGAKGTQGPEWQAPQAE